MTAEREAKQRGVKRDGSLWLKVDKTLRHYARKGLQATSDSDCVAVSRYFHIGTGHRRFVDKNNQNGLAIPYLRALFPDAHFVYIKRGPGDNINSLIEGWRRPPAESRWVEVTDASGLGNDGIAWVAPVPLLVDGLHRYRTSNYLYFVRFIYLIYNHK